MFAEAMNQFAQAVESVAAGGSPDPGDLYLASQVYRAAASSARWTARMHRADAKIRYLRAKLVDDPAAPALALDAAVAKARLLALDRLEDTMATFADQFEDENPGVAEAAMEPLADLSRLTMMRLQHEVWALAREGLPDTGDLQPKS
jgi:hypothetical protein